MVVQFDLNLRGVAEDDEAGMGATRGHVCCLGDAAYEVEQFLVIL